MRFTFQSHIGAIRIPRTLKLRAPLEADIQSHIGAIRIKTWHNNEYKHQSFQSHIGAIRIRYGQRYSVRHHYFNPTLVQLE